MGDFRPLHQFSFLFTVNSQCWCPLPLKNVTALSSSWIPPPNIATNLSLLSPNNEDLKGGFPGKRWTGHQGYSNSMLTALWLYTHTTEPSQR